MSVNSSSSTLVIFKSACYADPRAENILAESS